MCEHLCEAVCVRMFMSRRVCEDVYVKTCV